MLGACAREHPHILQPPGERVALALQLREAQQARAAEALAGGVPRGVSREVREPGCDDL
jgi:hypothetical protein